MAMTTHEIGKRLIALCNAGKHREAMEELYSDDHVSVEAELPPGLTTREVRGKMAVLSFNDTFFADNEIHRFAMDGPWPHDNAFICTISIDLTPKNGPMQGERIRADEAALFTVRDGKIATSQFFYGEGCA